MIQRIIAILMIGSAAPVVAEPFLLVQPVDCVLGQSCYIQQFVDHDPGPGARDFLCQGLSYDGHKGTDFALPTQEDMQRGVTVRAAAPGVVRGTRDGMADEVYAGRDLDNRDCGNGVVIQHADGWETQYCHLRRGSVLVRSGQEVAAGTALGLVGLSGRTEFPHLHLSVRKDGAVVDPFAPKGAASCDADQTLWADRLPYVPGGVIDVGFSAGVPDYSQVQIGTADDIAPRRDTALVGYGYAFGGRAGDVLRIVIDGPAGQITTSDTQLEKPQATFFRAAGRRAQPSGWPSGTYELIVQLLRGDEIISEKTETTTLR